MTVRSMLAATAFVLVIPMTAWSKEPPTIPAPEWTQDAHWYHVSIARFCNGEQANDPQGTLPWPADMSPPSDTASSPPTHERDGGARFGGDLQGLRSRLPYLKRLGVNALYLSPVFVAPSDQKHDPADWRHIDDEFAVAESLAEISGESHDPATWKWSQSDRLFLDFVAAAHQSGMRVIVEGTFSGAGHESWLWRDVLVRGGASPFADWFAVTHGKSSNGPIVQDGPEGELIRFKRSATGLASAVEEHLLAVTRRWMDPNGDGDPADGIDGWAVFAADEMPIGTVKRWRTYLKSINSDAVLIAGLGDGTTVGAPADSYDLVVDPAVGRAIRKFFAGNDRGYSLASLIAECGVGSEGQLADTSQRITATGGPNIGRLLPALFGSSAPGESARPDGEVHDRWRLAMTLHYLLPGVPMVYYGEEAGLHGHGGQGACPPMWWPDKAESGERSPHYRPDYFALVQQLHGLRERFDPLRCGTFHPLLLDEQRELIAFARSLPSDKVIAVMNYGSTAQEVTLPAGRRRQLLGIVSPELRPGPPHPLFQDKGTGLGGVAIPTLRLGGNRQYADGSGAITLQVGPKSIRLIVVRDRLE